MPGSPEEVTTLCRTAATDGHELVVIYGGDGTVSAAARGLLGTDVPLACIPGGFTNVLARTIGMPRQPAAAALRVAELAGRRSSIDISLGTADGRPYVFAAGVGFSAALMERLAADERFGMVHALSQAGAVIVRTIAGDAPRFEVDTGDGTSFEAIGLITQNSDPLTYVGSRPIRICDDAELGPAGFSVATLQSARVRDVARVVAAALSGRTSMVDKHPRMRTLPMRRELQLRSLEPEGMPIELDGDYLGRRHSVTLGVADEPLRVLA
jgi:diacylglycerol kinase family enzyme